MKTAMHVSSLSEAIVGTKDRITQLRWGSLITTTTEMATALKRAYYSNLDIKFA